MVKVTFTLDDETVQRLRRLSGRLQKPQSQVVRESIKEYEARSDTLSEDEQRRMLAALDRLTQTPPTRTAAEVDAELREIRRSRRRGWSTRAERRRR
ncbi:MAG TPA: ribbon-helix-helix protein, CopG family [Candidatus Binatia bacterium]|nr:ribbon-helix-helix protein, CopG family [Candidatus Binatia bacterium]